MLATVVHGCMVAGEDKGVPFVNHLWKPVSLQCMNPHSVQLFDGTV